MRDTNSGWTYTLAASAYAEIMDQIISVEDALDEALMATLQKRYLDADRCDIHDRHTLGPDQLSSQGLQLP